MNNIYRIGPNVLVRKKVEILNAFENRSFVFATMTPVLLPSQQFLFRLCSDLWRNCWRHLPFRTSAAPGEKVDGKFRSGPRR